MLEKGIYLTHNLASDPQYATRTMMSFVAIKNYLQVELSAAMSRSSFQSLLKGSARRAAAKERMILCKIAEFVII